MEQPQSSRPRNTASPSVDAEPIVELEALPRSVATGGRPKKLKRMPKLEGLSEAEQILFDDYIEEKLAEYPDISPSDYREVWLIAAEYIKYVRVINKEMKTGKVLSMARQHPGTNMRALEDQLAITRKARMQGKTTPEGGEEAEELRRVLYQVSNQAGSGTRRIK